MIFCKRLFVYSFLSFVSCSFAQFERMKPKENPFKKEKKVCPRLKFAKNPPKISEKEEKILDYESKDSDGSFWDRFEYIRKRKDKDSNKKYLEYKEFNEYTIPELEERKDYLIGLGNFEDSIKYLKRLLTLVDNQDKIKQYRFELADVYLESGKYQKALDGFADYVVYYPSDKLAEYASYMELIALDILRNDASRDQSFTKNLINRGKEFVRNPAYTKEYKIIVGSILQDAYEDYFQSEVLKFDFYARRQKIRPLEIVLENIQKDILPFNTKYQTEYQELEKDLQFIKDGKGYVPRSLRPKLKTLPRYKQPNTYKNRF